MTRHLKLWRLLSAGVLAGLVVACAEPEPASHQDALIEYILPEHRVPEDVWQMAPPSCEGLLSDDMVHISPAENAPSLGVVLDDDGEAICVDTWAAIRLEIDRVKGDPSPDPMHPLELPPLQMPGDS